MKKLFLVLLLSLSTSIYAVEFGWELPCRMDMPISGYNIYWGVMYNPTNWTEGSQSGDCPHIIYTDGNNWVKNQTNGYTNKIFVPGAYTTNTTISDTNFIEGVYYGFSLTTQAEIGLESDFALEMKGQCQNWSRLLKLRVTSFEK